MTNRLCHESINSVVDWQMCKSLVSYFAISTVCHVGIFIIVSKFIMLWGQKRDFPGYFEECSTLLSQSRQRMQSGSLLIATEHGSTVQAPWHAFFADLYAHVSLSHWFNGHWSLRRVLLARNNTQGWCGGDGIVVGTIHEPLVMNKCILSRDFVHIEDFGIP